MIGIRVGVNAGINAGMAAGISADEVGGPSGIGLDLLLWFEGQSNELQADAGATGHSDSGYQHFTPFMAAVMAMLYATAPVGNPAGPQLYTTIATQPLQAYTTAGQANQGPWLQCLKFLIRYGGYTKVGAIITAISGSSLRRHRGVNAGFPTTPPTVYTSMSSFVQARQIEYGRTIDALCTVELETDAGDTTDTATAQTNMSDYIAAARGISGKPTMPYLIAQLNAATTFGPNQTAIRAAQAAEVAADTNAALLNFDRFPLAFDPHYASAEQNDMGDEFGAAILAKLKPGLNTSLGTGPAPWYQYASSGITCVASPASAMPRSGPLAADGDWEFLVVRTYSAPTTVTLTAPAGFLLVTSAQSSISAGTIVNNVIVYGRAVTTAILLANGGRMPPPTVDGGTATRIVARIFGVRGPNKWTVSPVAVSTVGANNASNTALSIASATTTAANQLAVMFMATAGLNNGISTIANSNMTGITKWWDSSYNPGDAFIGLAMATATIATSGTVLGSTTIATLAAGVNAGVLLLVTP